ncbi:hypothetical protein Vadar_029965 [Vaccinium darrowii]|uniref:Uncharacterized protein n=1 Tax=Vaccinium darrowii TaxID=229202 RepID=A0ACB7ZNP1_9ERIC|nr:hypothetical protein Vadar_029965 [Vaccinium darrowii]
MSDNGFQLYELNSKELHSQTHISKSGWKNSTLQNKLLGDGVFVARGGGGGGGGGRPEALLVVVVTGGGGFRGGGRRAQFHWFYAQDIELSSCCVYTVHPEINNKGYLYDGEIVGEAFDVAYNNIYAAQKLAETSVESTKGVKCKCVSRGIPSVGLYVPGELQFYLQQL